MDQIAYIYGETIIYWSSIITALAAAAGICFFWAFHVWKGNGVTAAAAAVPTAVVLSLVLGRLVHWYCRPDSYASLEAAMKDYTTGGFALMGAFAGCLITAVVLRILRISKSLPRLLDCMCVAGAAAISLGRMASFFNASDRGQILPETVGLPWAYPVLNTVSGLQEWRLATFLLQAIAAAVIFVFLVILLFMEREEKPLKNGDVTLLFMLLYGASQVVLDSTRYDSLYLRSNGFVSAVQILGAVGVVLPVIIISVRLVKAWGWRKWYPAAWAAVAALIGYAGYMEYYVQRHGNQAVFAYSNMSAALVGVIAVTLVMWVITIRREWVLQTPTIYTVHQDNAE